MTPMNKAHRPTTDAIFLIPFYDLFSANRSFRHLLATDSSPLDISALLTMFSYILTHAWSPISKRAPTYARISLNIMAICVEDSHIFSFLTTKVTSNMHICQQVCRYGINLLIAKQVSPASTYLTHRRSRCVSSRSHGLLCNFSKA